MRSILFSFLTPINLFFASNIIGQSLDQKILEERLTMASSGDSTQIMIDLSEIYRMVDAEKAEKFAEIAFDKAKSGDDIELIISAGNQLTMAQKVNGKGKQSLSSILEVYQYLEKINNDTILASTHLIRGHVYNYLGDFNEGIKFYHKSLEIFNSLTDSSGISYSSSGLGIIYYDLGEHDKALKYYKVAEQYWPSSDIKQKADLWNNLGAAYVEFEKWELAEENYLKALKQYKSNEWYSDVSLVYCLL